MYARVSKKGQVTIPKPIRDHLHIGGDSAVLFIVEDGEVKIKGVPRQSAKALAGSLNKYIKGYIPLEESRNKIKKRIADRISKEGREKI